MHRLTRERDEARAQLESAVISTRAGELANGKQAGEEEEEPPAKRVRGCFCTSLYPGHSKECPLSHQLCFAPLPNMLKLQMLFHRCPHCSAGSWHRLPSVLVCAKPSTGREFNP
jgi:hypothetical protein